jgi:hypothetical protein
MRHTAQIQAVPTEDRPSRATGQHTRIDYSAEAIPERDPAYLRPDGTLYEAQTVEAMAADVRLALTRSLVQLGMSAARAAIVARL